MLKTRGPFWRNREIFWKQVRLAMWLTNWRLVNAATQTMSFFYAAETLVDQARNMSVYGVSVTQRLNI